MVPKELPDAWYLADAADVCEKITDGTHDTPTPVDDGIPYITAIHVKNGTINFDECLYLPQTVHDDIYRRCNPEYGDLLIVNIGAGVGECGFVNVDYQFSLKNVALLKPNRNVLEPEFLLQQHMFNKDRIAYVVKTGGAQPFLSLKELKKLKISVPPLPEQRKIAQILSTWDKAIATTERLLANKQQQKKALMQRLLTGKQRFAGFEGEWQNLTLAEVAQITMGSSPLSTAYNDSGDGLPLIQGNADIKDRLSAPRIHTSQITKECFSDDVLLSVRAPVGTVAKSRHHACIGRGIAAIRAKGLLSQEYLYQLLLDFEPKWERLSQGSTFESVNSDDIKSLPVRLPCIKEQQKIASVLLATDTEITTIQSQLDNLKLQKKALMQQLLTGKRRVKVDEAAA